LPLVENRNDRKRMIMAALYGAGRNSMEKWGVSSESFEQMTWLRKQLLENIRRDFGSRTWGGKLLNEDFELSHWVQGSAADIAFEAFHKFQPILREKQVKPFAALHDGVLWLAPKEWEPSKDERENVENVNEIQSLPFKQAGRTKGFKHAARIRWKRLR
jgi:hypothetical protein